MNNQNLKTAAAEFNLYKVEDISQKHKELDYYEHRIKIGHQEIPEILTTFKSIEVGLFYECKIQDEGTDKEIYYIDHSYILVWAKGMLLMLVKSHKKGYYLHPLHRTLYKYQNISHYLRQDALKGIYEPNFIGVFTEKKVSQWVDYCEEYLKRMETLLNNVEDENTKIEQQIKDTLSQLEGAKVSTYSNRTYIDTDLFNIIFEHYKDQKYLSTKIEYKGGLDNVIKLTNLIK